MQAKAIPAPGSWGTKKTKPDEAAVLFRVESVDPVKEQFTVERFAGFDGAVPLFGRQSTISFATWQTGRYQPCDPPAAPVPEMLDRESAIRLLKADGVTDAEEAVANVRDELFELETDLMMSDKDRAASRLYLALRAHARWLDAQVAPPVEVFVPPEPVSDVVLTSQAEIADLKAEIAATHAEVAGLRADFRALVEAFKAAGGQLRLFPVAA
jgi:hypothetical protein